MIRPDLLKFPLGQTGRIWEPHMVTSEKTQPQRLDALMSNGGLKISYKKVPPRSLT